MSVPRDAPWHRISAPLAQPTPGTMATAKKHSAATGAKAHSDRYPGIGRSAITGRFMSVASARGHKKTAIVEGAGRKRKD